MDGILRCVALFLLFMSTAIREVVVAYPLGLDFLMLKSGFKYIPVTNASNELGVVFTAYSSVRKTFQKYVAEVKGAAQRLKKAVPMLPVAIAVGPERYVAIDEITDCDLIIIFDDKHIMSGVSAVFNHGGRDDGHLRQWLTRLLVLATLPFEFTVAIDSNSEFCSSSLLQELYSLRDQNLDFAYCPSPLHTSIPHNWFLTFRRNNMTEMLLSQWALEQLSTGFALDDQGTLQRAYQRLLASGVPIRLGLIPHHIAMSFSSLKFPNFFPRITGWINGTVQVLHSTPFLLNVLKQGYAGTEEFDVCTFLNSDLSLRLYVVHSGSRSPVVLNTYEECEQLLGSPCPAEDISG